MEPFLPWMDGPFVSTDIHTHLTGAPRSAELVRLGLLHDLTYPAAMARLAGVPLPRGILLAEADTQTLPGGIAAPARGSPLIRLRDLPPESLHLLADGMDVPPRPAPGFENDAFVGLERAYSVRRPLAASTLLLPDILRSVAVDGRRDGVVHIELSASAPLLDAPEGGFGWMQVASREALLIERDLGVRILFLATVNRHSPPAALVRALARLDDAMAAFPRLVGIDVAGHETNPTSDFMPYIEAWAAARIRRGLPTAVRIHAGETPYFRPNVLEALNGLRRIGLPPGMGRIGHALYGVGRREVAIALETGTVVEMGIGSNRALGYRAAPSRSGGGARLTRLIRAGVAAVLGTDGGGIYRTGSAREARRAMRDGATAAVMAEVARHEGAHIERMGAAFPGAFAEAA